MKTGLHSVSLSSDTDSSSTPANSLNKSVDDLRSVSQNIIPRQLELSSPSGHGSESSGSTLFSHSGSSYASSSLVSKAAYLIPQSVGPSAVSVISSKHLDELLSACQAGDLPRVKKMIKEDSSLLFAKDLSGRSALHFACSYGRYDIVKYLLSLGADPDSISNSGETPLHVACISGQARIIQLLVSHVSDIDATDKKGQTPTHYAVLNGEIVCLNILCNQGADICMEDKHQRTAVHLAATRNHCDVIQFLLEHGIELDGVDFEGRNPAHHAAACGNLECLKLLVDNAIDILAGDNGGDQPIHDAAKNNHLPCLKLLLKKGAKLHATNNHNRGLLHKVCAIHVDTLNYYTIVMMIFNYVPT